MCYILNRYLTINIFCSVSTVVVAHSVLISWLIMSIHEGVWLKKKTSRVSISMQTAQETPVAYRNVLDKQVQWSEGMSELNT